MNIQRLISRSQQLDKKKPLSVLFSDGTNLYTVDDIRTDGLRTQDGEESVVVITGKKTIGKIG